MLFLNPPLTKDDFTNSRWQDVVNSSKRKDYLAYNSAFWKKAQEATEAGNIREQAVFEILAVLTSVAIKPESTDEIFTDVLQNLTDKHLNFLAEIAFVISDPKLQARVADILWVRRRDDRMGQLADTAYLQSATKLEDPEKWTCCFDRIERALQISRTINHQRDTFVNYIEILDRYDRKDLQWLSATLIELLQEYRLGDPTKYAALTKESATPVELTQDLQRVEQSDPWIKFAGMFKDDPLFDEFVEDMAAYRRELDAEVAANEISSEERQSA